MVRFDTLNLSQPVLQALADMGFEEASPIQAAAIPVLIEGRDVIGQAQTGTGKTAAFGIPLVMAAEAGATCLVLAPTRELAQQVAGEIDRIGAHNGVRALALYGGAPFGPQARALSRGKHRVLVATPGRLRDHFKRGTADPSIISHVVLDEADEMLNMGFIEEVQEILDAIDAQRETRQTLLFSATMPDAIRKLAQRYLENPEHVKTEGTARSIAADNTEQLAVQVHRNDKLDVLLRILAAEQPTGTLVFRHTRDYVDELVKDLRRAGVTAEALHGGMAQAARDDVVARLRDGRAKVLVATNVAARGLDIDNLSHVVNYDTPKETEAYVHRIGRTGRAGRSGRSFLFVTPGDRRKLRDIERLVGERLDWYDVPTDEQVDEAVTRNLAEWVAEQAKSGDDIEQHLTAIDTAVENGADVRVLAAAALRAAAKHAGLGRPPLEKRRNDRGASKGPSAPVTDGPTVPLAFSLGRHDGIRPGDLVGALTNAGGLTGAEVGRIDITNRISVAEIPAARAEEVLEAMNRESVRNQAVRIWIADDWQFRGPTSGPQRRPRKNAGRPQRAQYAR